MKKTCHHVRNAVVVVFTIFFVVLVVQLKLESDNIGRVKEFCAQEGWAYNSDYTTTPYACWDLKNGEILQRNVKVHTCFIINCGWSIFWVDMYEKTEK